VRIDKTQSLSLLQRYICIFFESPKFLMTISFLCAAAAPWNDAFGQELTSPPQQIVITGIKLPQEIPITSNLPRDNSYTINLSDFSFYFPGTIGDTPNVARPLTTSSVLQAPKSDSNSRECDSGSNPVGQLPVIYATGEKLLEQEDYIDHSLAGLGLSRTYRSQQTRGSLFGPKWLSTFDYPSLWQPSAGRYVFTLPSGAAYTYT
jgi:hypothetical protein